MPKISPADAAARWAQGAAGASTRYVEGAMSVTAAPGAKAAAKKEKYRLGVTQAVDKWASKVASVPLQSWQAAVAEKGASRYSQGVAGAETKMASFNQQFFPFLQGVQNTLAAMPDMTLEQRAEKAKQAALLIAKFQRR